jgi:glycine/D-amino acid oxidase-like deaminating enzyme
LYGGLFENAEFEGIERVLVSSTTGWAEAGKALAATVAQAVREGVQYLQGNVVSLALDEATRDCFGVNTAAKETVTGSRVILCTGAGTAKLLADSAPGCKELHAGKRFIAAGMCTALMTPEPEACAKYKDVPIVIHERIHHEGRGEFAIPS